MAGDQIDHDALIAEFMVLTETTQIEARDFLEANHWDISSAAAEYYIYLEETALSEPIPEPNITRASGNDSTPQPIPTTSSVPPPAHSMSKQPPKKKFATLGDLGGPGSSAPMGRGRGLDDDDDDDHDDDQDFFAGGEKSGLAVQNPDELKRKILEKARKNAAKAGGDGPAAPTSSFTGTARTLGGDDTPSQIIEDPNASNPPSTPRIHRYLHFWEDGFSVDDGPLYRTDIPANAEILRQIKKGSAPLSIMNVDRGQEVSVALTQHSKKYNAQEAAQYGQPKKKNDPFSGSGQRLGSPTPTVKPNPEPVVQSDSSSPESAAVSSPIEINESKPTVSLQIRLGDGTRLVARFNTTHTIGDIYSFVAASNQSSQGRNWVLMTTFPNKELQDKGQELGDLAELRRGGVVVQKWQ